MDAVRSVVITAFCGLSLCLVSGIHVASSSDEKIDKVVKGKVLHIEGDDYIVKNEDGNEVHLRIDKTTTTDAVGVHAGDSVIATVSEGNHVISLGTDQNASSIQRGQHEER